jgi:hypothetical protein
LVTFFDTPEVRGVVAVTPASASVPSRSASATEVMVPVTSPSLTIGVMVALVAVIVP